MTTASSPARRVALFAGLLTVALISCGRELTGPGSAPVNAFKRVASFAFAPQYETAVQGATLRAALLAVAFEKVRITLRREDGSIALDTVVDFPAGADELTLSFNVPLPANAPSGGVPLNLSLGYVNAAGDTVFRGGPQAVIVAPSTGGNPPPPVQIPVHYTGPGALATRVVIAPQSAAGTVGQLLSFGAQALGANGQPIANTPLVFTSSNPQVARVNNPNAGAVTLLARGRAFIYAQSLTGLTDSAQVDVLLPASVLALVSGSGQTARVSTALPQPIVAKVTASDGVPVSGVTVGFAVASGGGAVAPASAVSDANGLVSAAWTLGPTAGVQSVSVTSTDLSGSPLSVSATAQPLPVATTLVISTQPASGKITAALGAVVVTAKDATGNTATTFAGAVTVALASNPSGATLGGTTTVQAVAGVATFSTLTLDRLGIGYSYTFTTAGLPSVTSTPFSITAGDATRLAVGLVPPSLEAGGTLSLTVSALDVLGNLSPFTGAVSLALGAGPAGARLSGTLTQSAVAGLATFSDLSVDRKGTGYTLVASASGLTSGTSAAFAVKAAEPTTFLLRRGNNQSRVTGTRLDTIEVQVLDVFGNGVEGRTVAFAITQGSGTLAAASAITDSAGIGRPVWTVGGGAQQMTATLTGTPVLPALTINATGLAGPAAKLVLTTGPGTSQTAGVTLTPAIVVQSQDAGGLAQAAFTGAVKATIASGPTGATLGGTTTVTAVSGVATFGALRLTRAGAYSLSFESPNMTPAATSIFVVTTAPAVKIAADSGEAQAGTAGTALAKPFVVLVVDSLGNPVSGTAVTWAVAGGGGAVSAATTTTDANGRARTTLTLGSVAGANSVTATSTGLGGSPLTFSATGSAGAAAQLVIISSSLSTAVSGVAGTIVVYAVDVAGNVATGFTGVVSATIASGPAGATIGGPSTTTASAGVATFAGVWLDKAGAYTVTFSATGVASATSPSFVVIAGTAKNLGYAASSGNSQSGTVSVALSSPLRVKVTDAYGNAVQGTTVTWSVTAGGGSVSSASGTTDALGEAATTWTLGSIAGANEAQAASTGLTGSPLAFAATATGGAATQLVLSTQPQATQTAGTLGTNIVVHAKDAQGNLATAFTSPVTIAIASGPTGATVIGGASVNAAAGVATFGVSFDKAGTYTLTFASSGLTSVTTTGFTVGAGAAKYFGYASVSGNTQNGTVSAALASPLRAKVTDMYGNAVQGSTVTWSVTSGGGSVSPAIDTSDTLGETTTTWTLGSIAGANGAQAVSTGLTGSPLAFSATGTAGAATKLLLGTSAAGAAAGAAFTTQPVITVSDASGNTVTTDNGTVVTMAVSSGGTVVGTATRTAAAGVAAFSGVGISGTAGTSYTLTFAATGLTSATQTITPTVGALATVTLSPASASILYGQNQQLTAALKDAGGNTVSGTVTWSSSDISVATVSTTGLVTAVIAGSATITATSTADATKQGTSTITITASTASQLTLMHPPPVAHVAYTAR